MNPIPTGPALHPTAHFVERLHERFPGVVLTESALARQLAAAKWYAASGPDRGFYALLSVEGRPSVVVADLRDALLTLITIFTPDPGWDLRIATTPPLPLALLAGGA